MSLKIASVLELSGFEKYSCVHGNWSTICHAAHLTGDHRIIVNNIPYIIPHLLKRHPRMRTRLHIEGYQHSLQIFDYDEEYLKADLFYSVANINDKSHPHIPVKAIRLNGEPTPFRIQPIKNNFLFTSSSSIVYSCLHEKCRNQQITLNGPLFGCLLLAFHHCFPSEKKNNRYLAPFNVDLAVNMRSRLPQSSFTSQTVGFCVSICEIKLKRQLSLHSTPFWTLAKKCMTTTNKALANENERYTMHVYNNILSNSHKFDQFSQFYPEGLTSELCLSNIGKYPFPCNYNQGQLRLQGLHVINNCSVYYSTAMFFVTCAGDDQLDFSLSHAMETEEKAQEFLDYYVRLIEACAIADIGITLEQLLRSVQSQ
ncbi:unnamed protein product [Rotaria sp. Silwood2]|nr:unnamed protein product [Rotaria sp. Silwood2]CAF4035576.1 unnamed protein product [Rotaria sp. Silwood2]